MVLLIISLQEKTDVYCLSSLLQLSSTWYYKSYQKACDWIQFKGQPHIWFNPFLLERTQWFFDSSSQPNMECSTCKDQVITFPCIFQSKYFKKTRNLLIESILGPFPLLHTRTLMTWFTFTFPFFFKKILLLLLFLFIHVALFCILVAKILFSSTL